ncbi:MAG: DUF86 domain-containing protein [Nanoarchaeota archaeon]|nr:DUF86 domain-containing protein [Nanoarchaeota archaeon]
MLNRIKDKIIEIEKFLKELETSLPENFEEYKTDFKLRAIGERYFEKIIEAVIDLTFLIIKEKNLEQPEEDKQSFDILAKNKILDSNLSIRLQNAKGMRNIIAHEYGRIDNELVFHSLVEELIPDVQEFLKRIEEVLK